MPNAAKPGPEPPAAPPKDVPEAARDPAEASESAALGPNRAAAPPALPPPTQSLRLALADPPASGSVPTRRVNLDNAVAEEPRKVAAPASVGPLPSDSAEPPRLHAPRLSGRLEALAETAKAYARAAQADNTQRAYSADWRHFASWLRRQGFSETPPNPEAVGLYLASQVERRGAELSVATLERRLSGIAWRYRQLGQPLAIRDRHIATVLAGIRRRHGRPPLQKAAIFADELLAMLATLDMDLRGLRDRAILAIGFAGGLRRSEIVGLDCGPAESEDGSGWIEILPEGALLTIRGKTGWREVEIGRGSRADTCPVALLETWLRLGRISHGPLFRPIARRSGGVGSERLTDKHVVRLVKRCALAAGLRGDLTEGDRGLAFGGHSLRAGLASSAQIEEAHVQKHLGHASAEMTRRYQRKRDRFTINLTKAAGL
jgi:integrase